jgi:hypothetical protein
VHLPSPSERLRRTAVTLVNAPLMGFVRLVCPASVSTRPVHSPEPRLRSAMGYDTHRHVPPSWFCTTSTVFSRTGSRALHLGTGRGSPCFHLTHPVTRSGSCVLIALTPLEEFPSPVAVPHHCGRCLLAVHATRTTHHTRTAGRPSSCSCTVKHTRDGRPARVRSSRLSALAGRPTLGTEGALDVVLARRLTHEPHTSGATPSCGRAERTHLTVGTVIRRPRARASRVHRCTRFSLPARITSRMPAQRAATRRWPPGTSRASEDTWANASATPSSLEAAASNARAPLASTTDPSSRPNQPSETAAAPGLSRYRVSGRLHAPSVLSL